MGTETNVVCVPRVQTWQGTVKLNNPQMGTETG